MLPTLLLASTLTAPPADYAVLVSKQTDADPAWHKVVQKLADKHNGAVITYEGDIASARTKLSEHMPLHTAIVARPEELGRGVVAGIHRTMRKLDDDPYTDTLWGIVTGLTADDALALVSDDKPLVIKNAISTTGINGGLFDQMFTVSDGDPGAWVFKNGPNTTNGGTKDDTERNSDRAALFAQHFTEINRTSSSPAPTASRTGLRCPGATECSWRRTATSPSSRRT
ncbi:MAG TPA: hypothetical protein VEB22_12510, partial [Phycisphaerales bacterium]|nr:hypothetical protein [Phycisphaerales bacterium]